MLVDHSQMSLQFQLLFAANKSSQLQTRGNRGQLCTLGIWSPTPWCDDEFLHHQKADRFHILTLPHPYDTGTVGGGRCRSYFAGDSCNAPTHVTQGLSPVPPTTTPPAHRVLSGRSWRIKFSWIACGSCHSLLLPPVCQLCLAHLRPKPRPGCLDYRSRTAESAQGWPHPPGQRGCPLPHCLLPAARLSQALEPTCCQPDRASRRRAGNQAGVSLPEVTLCQTAGSSLSTSWAHFV